MESKAETDLHLFGYEWDWLVDRRERRLRPALKEV